MTLFPVGFAEFDIYGMEFAVDGWYMKGKFKYSLENRLSLCIYIKINKIWACYSQYLGGKQCIIGLHMVLD